MAKQHDQCVEQWWAIKMGDWRNATPFFLGTGTGKSFVPVLYPSKAKAIERIDSHFRQCPNSNAPMKPVKVIISTLGLIQRS